MLNPAQTQRMLSKLRRLEETYRPYGFETISSLDFSVLETEEELFTPPDTGAYRPLHVGDPWGIPRGYGWFRTSFTPEKELLGKALYLYPHWGGAEGLLYVNGFPKGIFTLQNGNHSVACLTVSWDGSPLELSVEMYTGHHVIGTQPLENGAPPPERYRYEGAEAVTKNETVLGFLFDLHVLRELAEQLPESSFRRAGVLNCLTQVFQTVEQAPADCPRQVWESALEKARAIMAPCLAAKNGSSAPYAGMVGHSHMDTCWLWPWKVTLKKCARTYANQLNLMEQYPEHRFFQSSAYHLELMRRYYPGLFTALSEKIREGRYEPNGGVWVECDCNVPSGESIVRQFLWGQRFTQKYFGYRSNCFWLPDTFGYSAALPQIMKGAGVDYFVTTKLSWNDTTRFPWETFRWEGMDGSRVFTHFTVIQNWPTPGSLIPVMDGTEGPNAMPEKRVTNRRLLPYGYGDGGGGPMFEMLELARRCKDLEGCPKVEIVSAGDFLRDMERTACDPPVYRGELYLELHRGTLTNLHQIKRNNRKAEVALHNLELVQVLSALRDGKSPSEEPVSPLLETLLLNQFHDILPGTCIQEVHEEAERQVADVIEKTEAMTCSLLETGDAGTVTLLNPLGFTRRDTVYLSTRYPLAGFPAQRTENLMGEALWAVDGVELAPLAAAAFPLGDPELREDSPFVWDGKTLSTPFAHLSFDENGQIESFYDLRLSRELRDPQKLPLNTFLFGEDMPAAWDNWDVDADLQMKLLPAGKLVSREIVSQGAVEFRLRSVYRLTEKTVLRQDMIFHASSPRVDFETELAWHERHHFLKAAFDLDLFCSHARNEIQFGCCLRPTTRNTPQEQAMFEVCNHRYTDLSEPDQGAAVLNDCKYGVSVEGGSIRLSLHKGGCRPDDRGDAGLHRFTYSFFPHAEGFGPRVVQEGYLLNFPPVQALGSRPMESLASVDRDSVILETVKPCEDRENAFILRLYESVGAHTSVTLSCPAAGSLQLCNLLEEPLEDTVPGNRRTFSLRPFQILTVKAIIGR